VPQLTPIFSLSDRFVAESAALDPYAATRWGIPGFDHLVTDYSPEGCAARADHMRRTLSDLAELEPQNGDDRLAKDHVTERLEATLAVHDGGEWMRPLRAISAPASTIRSSFDLMPRDGEAAWQDIADRVHAVPVALDGVRAALEAGRAQDVVASQRQTEVVAAQCATWADDRWFDTLMVEASARDDLSPGNVERLRVGVDLAVDAYGAFAGYLRDEYLQDATPVDACGLERYTVGSRLMNGADLDPAEMYDWAWNEYHALRAEILKTCELIKPGASFAPEQMNRCEAHIPPAGSAAAPYYTGPSEDFSRPGRTWYPALGRTSFAMWGDVTTCYHESVPGHHMQIGYSRLQGERLSRFQRASFVSGHGEGWALYAERLCDELGWFENPDHRLGFLCGQQLRAVRVIIDIGMHLGLRIPVGTTLSDRTPFYGGEVWTPDLALEFAISETGQGEPFLRSEIDRYLGWPAQAISYKIGEREWLAARADAKSRLGGRFDLRTFHTVALSLGPVGLAQLRAELSTAI
jgi:uncharacterized protein (DUF885 family)